VPFEFVTQDIHGAPEGRYTGRVWRCSRRGTWSRVYTASRKQYYPEGGPWLAKLLCP
jgi:hypothetical protein